MSLAAAVMLEVEGRTTSRAAAKYGYKGRDVRLELPTAIANATTHPMKVQPRNTLTTITAPRCFALRTAAITVGRK
jgi:hypothetical protein